MYLNYLAVTYLCFISAVSSQLPQKETYDYCDPTLELCESPAEHIMCKYPVPGLSSQCTPSIQEPLSATEKKKVIFWHNKFRSNVASGTEKNKNRKLPTASNMRQIYWDNELETLAARWAEQCTSITSPVLYDSCRNTKRFQVSQNVGTRQVNGTVIDKQAPQIVIAWYKESRDFHPGLVDKFVPVEANQVSLNQFVNIIWAETYLIGCARIIFREKVLKDSNQTVWTVERLVCNYGPGGSRIGKPVYKRGVSCGNCPPGTQCSRVFPGLCATQNAEKGDGQNFETNETEKEPIETTTAAETTTATTKTTTATTKTTSTTTKTTPATTTTSTTTTTAAATTTSKPKVSVTETPQETTKTEEESKHIVEKDDEDEEEEDCEGDNCQRTAKDPKLRLSEIIESAKPTARKKSRDVDTVDISDIYTENGKWSKKVRRSKWKDHTWKNGDKCKCYVKLAHKHLASNGVSINGSFIFIFFSFITFYFLL